MQYAVCEGNLTQRWRRCKQFFKETKPEEKERTFWQGLREQLQTMTKSLIEVAMEGELTEVVGAGWYERKRQRRGRRNGHYERNLDTQYGELRGIRVPRPRRGKFHTRVFRRYQRRSKEVDEAIEAAFVSGVSTRRVEGALRALLGTRISAGTVSRVTKALDHEVKAYQNRRILDQYQYLLLDGIRVKVRGAVKVTKKLVLVAYGITIFGEREIIDFRVVRSESEAQWEAFLDNLRQRGLEGKYLKLITTDGCKGLHSALDVVYAYTPRQRCWAHKLRNVAGKLPRRVQAECMKGARKIYQAKNRRGAVRAFKRWEGKWKKVAPKAVKCLREDLDELLNFLDVPEEHRVKVRTTNVIERTFREIRRRIRPMSSFPTTDSCERIIYSVFAYLNEKWRERPLKEFTQFA